MAVKKRASNEKNTRKREAKKCRLSPALGWISSFVLGSSWLVAWAVDWNLIESEANTAIEIISLADGRSVTADDDLDSWLSIVSVQKKARFIRQAQVEFHNKEKRGYFATRDDISWNDRESWRSAVKNYLKIEERLHPEIYKQVVWNKEWRELVANIRPLAPQNAAVPTDSIPKSTLFKVMGLPAPAPNSPNTPDIVGVFLSAIPTNIEKTKYPVIDTQNPKVREILKESPHHLHTSKRFFVPNITQIPEYIFLLNHENEYKTEDKVAHDQK